MRFIFHSPAVRAATLGSWRMLTLGAEYEDTWAPSPDKSRRAGQQVEEEPWSAEGSESGAGDTEEPSWKAADTQTVQKYDAVLHLDGLSRAGRSDGLRQIVRRHELLNGTPWSRR